MTSLLRRILPGPRPTVLSLALLSCGVAWLAARSRGEGGLLGAPPMAGRPTPDSITVTLIGGVEAARVSVELAPEVDGRPGGWRVLEQDSAAPGEVAAGRQEHARWTEVPAAPASWEVAPGEYLEVVVHGLGPGTAWWWRVSAAEAGRTVRSGPALRAEEFRGRVVTMRPAGDSFTFDLISDMHFFIDDLEPAIPEEARRNASYLAYVLEGIHWFRDAGATVEAEFTRVAANVRADRPDFVVGLGDHFDLHSIDFNAALLNPAIAEAAHGETREHLARELSEAGSLFQVLGNWEAESGDHALEHRAFGRQARRRHQINPRQAPPWYRAAPHEDYWAFDWGDLLVVGLNVRGYTTTSHLLGDEGENAGTATDFTLGADQRAFLERELSTSEAPYKVLCIHHVVGGNGGDRRNTDYGRGGGRAARVGEQEWVHELMLRHGAQVMFYGHDHVFADMVVDGIHYSIPGTTGAPWRFTTAETGYQQYWSEAGHGRVRVTPEAMTVEFVDFTGEVLHTYQVAPRD